jgi:hypothetical protein
LDVERSGANGPASTGTGSGNYLTFSRAVVLARIDIASIAAVLRTSLVITPCLSFQSGKLAAANPENWLDEA